MNIAIFAVDPGGHTGIAWGVFNPNAKSLKEALLGKMVAGSTTITGELPDQVVEICKLWQSFYESVVRDGLLPPERVFLVCEDFVPRGGQSGAGKEGISPAFLIGGIDGYRMGRRDEWRRHRRGRYFMPLRVLQTAEQAKSHGKHALLKEWGVWVVGREHERSAWQHAALFLQKYMLGVKNAKRTTKG